MIDERTETLITRRLDGELSAEQSLELDKLLIRSPEARALLEESERIDRLAATALRGALAHEPAPPASVIERAARRKLIGIFSGTGTVAAAILLAVVVGGVPRGWLPPAPPTDHIMPHGPLAGGQEAAGELAFGSLIDGPRHEAHRIVRDVFGIYDDETQSIYLLEMDHQQTTVVPVTMNY
jgi:anti-sigma factor RsiW